MGEIFLSSRKKKDVEFYCCFRFLSSMLLQMKKKNIFANLICSYEGNGVAISPGPLRLNLVLVLPVDVLVRQLEVPDEVARVLLAGNVQPARLALPLLGGGGESLEVVPDHGGLLRAGGR